MASLQSLTFSPSSSSFSANVPDYQKVMSRSNYGAKTPLQRSLSKLEAEREVQTWAAKYAAEEEEDDDGTDGKLTLVEEVGAGECSIEDGGCFDPDRPNFEQDESSTNVERKIIASSAVDGGRGEDEFIAPLFNSNGPCVQAMPAGQVVPGIGPVSVQKRSSLIVMIRHGKTENNKLGLFTG
jgi:hypothetical protein